MTYREMRNALESWAAANAKRVPPTEYRIPRQDTRDLSFSGWEIARKINESDYNTIEVMLYLTAGSKIVTHVREVSKYDVTPPIPEKNEAFAHEDPDAALEWLIAKSGGKLGRVSKAAWESACERCEPLAEFATERVD